MELATALHHSSQRPKLRVVEGPSEGEVRKTHDALRRLKVLLPGMRPASLAEPQGPKERIWRHILEQMAEFAPVEHLILKLIDTQSPVEQVIDVNKIILDQVSQRSSLRAPQMAGQLVDVPVPPVLLLASGRDSAGHEWFQLKGRLGVYWWMVGTNHTPEGFTASPRLVMAEVLVIMHDKFRSTWRCSSSSSTEWWTVSGAVWGVGQCCKLWRCRSCRAVAAPSLCNDREVVQTAQVTVWSSVVSVCGGFWKSLSIFHVEVYLDPVVVFSQWKSGFPRAPCIWQSLRRVHAFTEAFGRISAFSA